MSSSTAVRKKSIYKRDERLQFSYEFFVVDQCFKFGALCIKQLQFSYEFFEARSREAPGVDSARRLQFSYEFFPTVVHEEQQVQWHNHVAILL